MKRSVILAMLALLALLLAGCSADVPMENGEHGYASEEIGLVTDGRRVVLERRGTWWSADASSIIEVTGGSERFVTRVYHVDDMAVDSGKLWVVSHTEELLPAEVVSRELDRYNLTFPAENTLHVSTADEEAASDHRYALSRAAEGAIRHGSAEKGGHAFSGVKSSGAAGDPFYTIPERQFVVTDTFIASADPDKAVIEIYDLEEEESYEFSADWKAGSWNGGAYTFPRGVLLDGVLWHLREDGVWGCEMESGEEKLLMKLERPEYFYVTDDLLYTVADDGLLTAYELETGEAQATAVELGKGERYVVAGENVYILQTPETHDVTEDACRIESLAAAEEEAEEPEEPEKAEDAKGTEE